MKYNTKKEKTGRALWLSLPWVSSLLWLSARNSPLLPLPRKTGISQLSSVDSNMAARSVQTRQVSVYDNKLKA